MKMYVLTATLEKLTTSIAIQARDNFSAKVLAVNKINANFISDKRYALGLLTLKDPDGKVVWEAEEEGKKEVKKGGE
jgi:hypothetical protein